MNSSIRFSWMAISLWFPLFVRAQPSVLEPYDVYSCAGMIEYREAHQLAVLDPVNDFDQSWVLAMGGSVGFIVFAILKPILEMNTLIK